MKKLLNILGGLIISLGILGLVVLQITNRPEIIASPTKTNLAPVFEQNDGGIVKKTSASNFVSGSGNLRLGNFAFFQLTGNDSELRLLNTEFDNATHTVSEASGKIDRGGILAVNLVFGQKISLEDDHVKAENEGGSFIFEKKDEFEHIKVLSGVLKLTLKNPSDETETFEGVLVPDQKVLLTENSIKKIFEESDPIKRIFIWEELVGSFQGSYPGESNMLSQLLDVINVKEKNKLRLIWEWSKEKLLFSGNAIDRFYADEIHDLLGRVAAGNARAVTNYLSELSPSIRESLERAAVDKTHYTKLFVGKELAPSAKKKIAELGEFDEYFANLTKTQALSNRLGITRDLVLLFDNPENKDFKSNFLRRVSSAKEDESQFVNAGWVAHILIENPKIISKEWLDVLLQLNHLRAKEEQGIYNVFADQIRLTDLLIRNNSIALASQSLKDFATILSENSDLFSNKELEEVALYGNDLKNKLVFVTTISESGRFDEKKYEAWLEEKTREEEEELAAAIASGEKKIARPKSEFEKFLDFLSFADELEINLDNSETPKAEN